MKNGQRNIGKHVRKTKQAGKSRKKQPRIYEFVQGVNGEFSNKRLMAIAYAIAAIVYAFYTKDPYITGVFAAASTGSSVGGVLEKKTQ